MTRDALFELAMLRVLQGLRGNATDACEEHDPCQHGGICISTDSGPICECRNVDYEGTYCEKGEYTQLLYALWLICLVGGKKHGKTDVLNFEESP